MVQRHLRRHVLVRIVREVGAERRRQLDLAGLRELQDRDGGDHLVHRSHPEARLGRVRRPLVAIGQPISAGEENLPALRDGHGAGEPIGRGLLGGPLPQRAHDLRLAEPRNRELRGPRHQSGGSNRVIGCGGAASTSTVICVNRSDARSPSKATTRVGVASTIFFNSKPPVKFRNARSVSTTRDATGGVRFHEPQQARAIAAVERLEPALVAGTAGCAVSATARPPVSLRGFRRRLLCRRTPVHEDAVRPSGQDERRARQAHGHRPHLGAPLQRGAQPAARKGCSEIGSDTFLPLPCFAIFSSSATVRNPTHAPVPR